VLCRSVSIRRVHQFGGVLITVTGVSFGAFGLSDAQRVSRFEKFERQLRVQCDRVKLIAGGNVASAFHKFKFGIDCFARPLGIDLHDVLKYDDVAWLVYGKVGLRGYDQRERLKTGWLR
jgi:hypothetical protein